MLSKLSRSLAVCLSVIVSGSCAGVAAQVQRDHWPLIRIPDPLARRATIRALAAAATRLADADCRKVLSDFENGDGATLADQLSSLGVDIQAYLTMVTFIDDTRHTRCTSGVLAFTAPGSRVVRVCVDELKRISAHQPEYVVASFIHEILHTLGLGESPPSPSEITARVVARCGLK